MALQSGQLDQIAAGVRRLVARNPGVMTGPGTNTYLIGVQRCLVIDPGPDDPVHLERILAEAGQLEGIAVTHTHPDHSPGAAVLARASGAPVYGMQRPVHGRQDAGFAPTQICKDGDCIPVEEHSVRALHTPGHASNHLCFLLEGQGLLFSGDHLMQGSTVVIAPPDGDMRQYIDSLERLAREPVERIAPGHGLVIEEAKREIARVIAHRLARESKTLQGLAEVGPATLDALVKRVYDDVDTRLHPVAMSSLLAHLLKLEQDGKVSRDSAVPEARWQLKD